jgi:hypothetical protein
MEDSSVEAKCGHPTQRQAVLYKLCSSGLGISYILRHLEVKVRVTGKEMAYRHKYLWVLT